MKNSQTLTFEYRATALPYFEFITGPRKKDSGRSDAIKTRTQRLLINYHRLRGIVWRDIREENADKGDGDANKRDK